jgi:Tfp pilus assembly protein PilO
MKGLLGLIFLCFVAFLAFDAYSFFYSAESELGLAKADYEQKGVELAAIQSKLKSAETFVRGLDEIRERIRGQSQRIEESKMEISEAFEVSEVVKALVVESTKVGLRVPSVQPKSIEVGKYYDSQTIEIQVQGVFYQLFALLERLSALQRIVQVEVADIKSIGESGRFTKLDSKLVVRIFRYKSVVATQKSKDSS